MENNTTTPTGTTANLRCISAEDVWEAFVRRLTVKAFGEQAVIMEGKKLKNLLGSVDSHKAVFMEAVEDLFA